MTLSSELMMHTDPIWAHQMALDQKEAQFALSVATEEFIK